MPHDAPLIATLVGAVVLAFVFGVIAHRLRISPLAGYLFAGVVVGPFTPGFVANQSLASQLAEIGVILLMFGVGLHFSIRDLLSVKLIVGPGAIAQILLSTLLGFGLGLLLGWEVPGALVFGLGLAVASTVVTLRALQERRLMDSRTGHITVGWLVTQDLAMVLVLVLLPGLAGLGGSHFLSALAITFGKLIAFALLMLLVGRRVIPWMLHYVAHTGSRELFRLAVLAIALGVAYGAAQLFGVSLALGAFFAGVILSESELAHQAAQESLPLRDAFAVLFFVSMGMLFNPMILVQEPLSVLGVVAIILIGNTGIALAIQLALRQPFAESLTVAANLSQIGEFSFILVNLGVALGLLVPLGRDLVLAGAILSILLHPALLAVTSRLGPRLDRRRRQPAPCGSPGAGTPASDSRHHAQEPHGAHRLWPGRTAGGRGAGVRASALCRHRGQAGSGRAAAEPGHRGHSRQCRCARCAEGGQYRPCGEPGGGHPQWLRGRTDRRAGTRRQPDLRDHRPGP